jgi:phosphatidylserine/phosphatidylglycerophosphate/cardiolipin synthase-like enzyme
LKHEGPCAFTLFVAGSASAEHESHMKKHILPFVLCLLLAIPAAYGAEPSYELEFSPEGQSLQVILNGISSAEESIQVAAYSFTSKPIPEALLAAHRRGVAVAVVADRRGNSAKYTAVNFLANHKIPVRLNGRYAILHHKFMVFDGKTVQIGSLNYSAAAVNKNAENVLLLKDVPGIAAAYAKEWKRLWDEGIDVELNY